MYRHLLHALRCTATFYMLYDVRTATTAPPIHGVERVTADTRPATAGHARTLCTAARDVR
jgi:hypothetical protein